MTEFFMFARLDEVTGYEFNRGVFKLEVVLMGVEERTNERGKKVDVNEINYIPIKNSMEKLGLSKGSLVVVQYGYEDTSSGIYRISKVSTLLEDKQIFP